MKLWLLKRVSPIWAEYRGFVVSAESEEAARDLIFRLMLPEREIWADTTRSWCKQIGISILMEEIVLMER